MSSQASPQTRHSAGPYPDLRILDSHTEGEPTRVVVEGIPDLGEGDLATRREVFRRRHSRLRTALIHEPRGHNALVGALLLPPERPEAVAGMIFFNNADALHMCGHGTIGVVATLAHLGRIEPGRHLLESPVGDVPVELHADGSVSVDNVFSYRYRAGVTLKTRAHGPVAGDIAWGGNWFFLVADHGQQVRADRLRPLTDLTRDILDSLHREGITGADGAEIDHVELFAPPTHPEAHSKNFVLCPGGEYDRCPCGTGTSAKMACLAADGRLREGDVWVQEGILGSRLYGTLRSSKRDGRAGVLPTIRGRAWITADSRPLLQPDDPFRFGIHAAEPGEPPT